MFILLVNNITSDLTILMLPNFGVGERAHSAVMIRLMIDQKCSGMKWMISWEGTGFLFLYSPTSIGSTKGG